MKRMLISVNRFGLFAMLLIGLITLQGYATPPSRIVFFGPAAELKPDSEDASLLWWEKTGFS